MYKVYGFDRTDTMVFKTKFDTFIEAINAIDNIEMASGIEKFHIEDQLQKLTFLFEKNACLTFTFSRVW